ncbi:MAG: hypothetical protein EOS30_09880 [Mesorhizobium sp.]|uniref:hypothetical protein n=1 Tax=Mesorhizobium sp. TaxID=1871066 RepID=UPI000FE70BEC|nr:hypothetical protein [Mesorhizobium sp.]RWC76091.1 MAG: hypothetical protein EOS30_09880 [Mesorhizobium sp.]RWC91985.1 MAG: hypothetical protein EOS72_00195 [Mesorhizobium sp.]TIT36023.1 MAG: hypothetical protein E5W65_10940 [Mesorhizobium sp.]TIT46014.1 MAG: hypothetical protein E5W75_22150 [Mesorhizobium sp.]TIU47745.1 MAG: hypothetical protein E5W19_20750 [Mesorhizobium sp.]
MLKNIAFAALLIQVAAVSALTTQTLLFSSASTQASSVPLNEPVATAKDCAKTTRPDFPAHCVERVQVRKLIAMTAAQ